MGTTCCRPDVEPTSVRVTHTTGKTKQRVFGKGSPVYTQVDTGYLNRQRGKSYGRRSSCQYSQMKRRASDDPEDDDGGRPRNEKRPKPDIEVASDSDSGTDEKNDPDSSEDDKKQEKKKKKKKTKKKKTKKKKTKKKKSMADLLAAQSPFLDDPPELYADNCDYYRNPVQQPVRFNVEKLYTDVYVERTNDVYAAIKLTGRFNNDTASVIAAYDGRLVIYNALFHPWMVLGRHFCMRYAMYNVPIIKERGSRRVPKFYENGRNDCHNVACATLRGVSANSHFNGFNLFFDQGAAHCNLIPVETPIFQAVYTFDRDPVVGEVISFTGGEMYLDPVAAVQSYTSNGEKLPHAAEQRNRRLRPADLRSVHKPLDKSASADVPTPFDTLVVHLHDSPVAARALKNHLYDWQDEPYYPYRQNISRISIIRDNPDPVQSTVLSSRIFASRGLSSEMCPYGTSNAFDYIRLIIVKSVF
jgi:hypothetical protein